MVRHHNATNERPRATPWSSGGRPIPIPTTPDHGRAIDMAVIRYTELYGEAPDAEIVAKLAMVSDLEGDD
jgi:hypothetical protein